MKKTTVMIVVMALMSWKGSESNVSASTFDGDILADIFVSNGQGVQWFESTGGHTVSSLGNVYTGSDSTGIAVGRVDGDSFYDLFVGKANSAWYEGTGVDNTRAFKGFLGGNIANFSTGDLDGDGKGDVIWVDSNGNLDWYETTGNDTFGDVKRVVSGDALSSAVGDLDSDGNSDLMALRNGSIVWYESTGVDNGHGFRENFGTSGGALDAAFGDVDGDLLTDLFVVEADGTLSWYEGVGIDNGRTTVGTSIAGLSGLTSVAIGDVDGDGTSELLVGTSTGIRWLEGNGNNAVLEVSGDSFGGNVKDIAIVPVVVPVPEPATLSLLGLGSLLLYRRSNK